MIQRPFGASVATRAEFSFCAILIATAIVFWKAIYGLVLFSLHNDSGSHIILIPAVTAYFLFAERKHIFAAVQPSRAIGGVLIFAGLGLYWTTVEHILSLQGNDVLTATTIALVCIWIGGFLFSYGLLATRNSIFALSLLLLMIPLPDRIVDRLVLLLQATSTELSYLLFQAAGVPTLRHGFFLTVPGVTIEVARECSGIHSSIALFITTLLAAQLFLRGSWRKVLFVIVAVPFAIIKNAIRIVTLTLLAIHVDPSFLTGSLHHKGGIVFFLIALALLAPLLTVLRKSEEGAVRAQLKASPIVRVPAL